MSSKVLAYPMNKNLTFHEHTCIEISMETPKSMVFKSMVDVI